MPQPASSDVAPAVPFAALPLRAEQTSSRTAAVLMLLLLASVLGMVIVPVALVIMLAADELRAAIAHHPLGSAALAAGLFAWAGLYLLPAARVIQRLGRHRRIVIARKRVAVADASLLGTKIWTAPLTDFCGIVHHVRATLSGVRHELILVHPVRDRSVLLHAADAIAQSTIDRAVALLALPQIPARELYRLTRREPSLRRIDALPDAQPA